MPASEVFHKYGRGQLHSGSKSGPVVKNHAQAIAIYLSEKRKEAQHGGKYPERAMGGPAGFGAAPITPPMMPAGMPTPMGAPNMQGMQNNLPMGLGGRMGYALGGVPVYSPTGLSPGWVARQEARNMTHTGPIVSTVAGRTDHHPMSVPSGSYVLPAAHVSALGQGNTLAGMKVLQGMFGQSASMKRGMGPPRVKAPSPFHQQTGLGGIKLPKSLSSEGGLRGDDTGEPVPIMAAGGEFVLSPDQVAKVGGGDVNHGHAILDAWVKKTHKKYAKTVANLPPPAKS